MSCLYCATCSTGSVIPEYFVANVGMLYFFGTSTRAISSTNGEAWNPVLGSTSTGTAAPGNIASSANIFWFCSSKVFSRTFNGSSTVVGFVGMLPEVFPTFGGIVVWIVELANVGICTGIGLETLLKG